MSKVIQLLNDARFHLKKPACPLLADKKIFEAIKEYRKEKERHKKIREEMVIKS